MLRILIFFFSLMSAVSYTVVAQAARAQSNCEFDSAKRILGKTKSGYTAEWTLGDGPILHEPLLSTAKAFNDYVSWVRGRTKLSAFEKLELEIKIFEKALRELGPDDGGRAGFQHEIDKLKLIVSGKVGRIRPMQCLESLPFREFLQVNDLRRFPQEFQAVFLTKDGQVKIVGDFYHLRNGAQSAGITASAVYQREFSQLVNEGWHLATHLHNHPFDFNNGYGDTGGNLAPSAPDVQLYLELRPDQALITNGLETIELQQSEFNKL